jgi:hypothetical protein
MFEMLLGWLPIILAFLYFFGESFNFTRDFTRRNKTIIGWALALSLLATLALYLVAGKIAYNYLFKNPDTIIVTGAPVRRPTYVDLE